MTGAVKQRAYSPALIAWAKEFMPAELFDVDAAVADLKASGEIVIVDEKEGGKNVNSKNP